MPKFRAQLSSWHRSKKNGKALSGFLSVEEIGEIAVWNLARTTPLGTIGDLVDCQMNYRQVRFRTTAGDEVILSMKTRDDAETFFRLISAMPPPADQHWAGLIQTFAELRDAGLLTNEIFTELVTELSDNDLDGLHQAIEVERYRRLLNRRKSIEPQLPSP
jgi:hypothetical protein